MPKVATREAYGKALVELGRENPDIVVLGGDLNKSTFVHLFAAEFPDRFFDFGPAEQNIMGVAAGMAASGKIPFVSTFSVFGMCRPFDQVRVSIAQPHLGVKIVCTHAGNSDWRGRDIGARDRRFVVGVFVAGVHGGCAFGCCGGGGCGEGGGGDAGAFLRAFVQAGDAGASR